MASVLLSGERSVETFASAEDFLVSQKKVLETLIEDENSPIESVCILCELRLPGMSGIQLLQELKQRDWMLSVVIVSSYGSVPIAVSAMEEGAETFLEKPINGEKLIQAVDRALETSTSQLEASRTRHVIAAMSNSEQSVLRGIVAGKKNIAIATDIQLGLRTVELRRSKIMKALKVRSTAELVRRVVQAQPPHTTLHGPHHPELFRRESAIEAKVAEKKSQSS